MAEQNIEPFAFQKSTNIDEHRQMIGKINELVEGNNDLDNKRVNALEQSFDDENRILATTLKTVDGTEISGSVYVPGGGDGGDIVVDKIDYSLAVPDFIKAMLDKYVEGTYVCSINIKADLLNGTKEGDDEISFNATQFRIMKYNVLDKVTIYQIQFTGAGESAVNGTVRWVTFTYSPDSTVDTRYSATANIYRYMADTKTYENQGWNINKEIKMAFKGFVIKGIKGAAIQPYTASTGITIDDDNATIAVDTNVIATHDDITTVNGSITNVDKKVDTAYKSAYVEGTTMTFEKVNGDTDTVALPSGSSYVAGEGITINDNAISVDTTEIATVAVTDSLDTQVKECATGVANAITQAQNAYVSSSISDNHLVLTKGNGNSDEIVLDNDYIEITDINDIDVDKLKIGSEILISNFTYTVGSQISILENVKFTITNLPEESSDSYKCAASGIFNFNNSNYYPIIVGLIPVDKTTNKVYGIACRYQKSFGSTSWQSSLQNLSYITKADIKIRY